MFRPIWEPVSKGRLAAFAAGLVVFFVLLSKSEPGFVLLLDHANLLFHEAGHPLVGLFSQRLEPYGGTVAQLVFPVVVAVGFWRKGQPLGLAASVIWFSENLFNIARYVGDARTMELPLVGGGDHDWHTILSRWGALPYDGMIAAGLRYAGWAGIGLACLWVVWRAWKDRYRVPAERFEGMEPAWPDR